MLSEKALKQLADLELAKQANSSSED